MRIVNVTTQQNELGRPVYYANHHADSRFEPLLLEMPQDGLIPLRRGHLISVQFYSQTSVTVETFSNTVLLVEQEFLDPLVAFAAETRDPDSVKARLRELQSGQVYDLTCINFDATYRDRASTEVYNLEEGVINLTICPDRGVRSIVNEALEEITTQRFAVLVLTQEQVLVTDIFVKAEPLLIRQPRRAAESGAGRSLSVSSPNNFFQLTPVNREEFFRRLEASRLVDVPDESPEEAEAAGEPAECPICTLPMKTCVRALVGCGHKFHKSCINKWLNQKMEDFSCPNCRHGAQTQ